MSSRGSERSATEETYWRTLICQDPASLCREALTTLDRSNGTYSIRVADLTYTMAPNAQTIGRETTKPAISAGVSGKLVLLKLHCPPKWGSPVHFSGGDVFFSRAHNLEFGELLCAFHLPKSFSEPVRRSCFFFRVSGSAEITLASCVLGRRHRVAVRDFSDAR